MTVRQVEEIAPLIEKGRPGFSVLPNSAYRHWVQLVHRARAGDPVAELQKAQLQYPNRRIADDEATGAPIPMNPMRMGPLTMDARRFGLASVLAIQQEIAAGAAAEGRPTVTLIDPEEQARIEELIAANTWPNGWDGTEARGDVALPQVMEDGSVQHWLFDSGDLA
jgi:hypothetical protein